MDSLCLAIDIGGTKMCAGIVDNAGRVLAEKRALTPNRSGDDPAVAFAVLAGLIESVSAETLLGSSSSRIAVCGVGCGGPMTQGGETVSPLNIPGWRRFPLRQRIAEIVDLPVYVDNDAKALALGEWWKGSAQGLNSFLAAVVSTGVGGGIVLDGRLLDGNGGNCGHIGHVIVEPDGRKCACGARGCLEAEASGTAIEAITGQPAARASREVKVRTGLLVGRALACVANLLDLKLALIAGSVALGFGSDFFDAAQEELNNSAKLDFSSGAIVKPAGLGDGGPLLGAAAVGFRALGAPGPWVG